MVEQYPSSFAHAKGVMAKEEVLMPEYSPDKILHREDEIREIREAITPFLEGRQPENLFIYLRRAGHGKNSLCDAGNKGALRIAGESGLCELLAALDTDSGFFAYCAGH